MKRIAIVLLFLCTLGLSAQESRREIRKSREKEKISEIARLTADRDMRFLAQFAYPMAGGSLHLTSEYTLDIANDTLTAYLPFFGRAYHVDYGGREGGIKFSEKAMSSVWKRTKNGYSAQFEVKSPNDLYRLYLTIGTTGYANLDITSNNRQVIRFSGVVLKRKIQDP